MTELQEVRHGAVVAGAGAGQLVAPRSSGVVSAAPAHHRPHVTRCQHPHFRGQPGYAESFAVLEDCDLAASALIVHRAREVLRVDASGAAVPFALRATRDVVQVAAACLPHVASALRLNEAERRVLAFATTSTMHPLEHVDVLRLGEPVRVARVR